MKSDNDKLRIGIVEWINALGSFCSITGISLLFIKSEFNVAFNVWKLLTWFCGLSVSTSVTAYLTNKFVVWLWSSTEEGKLNRTMTIGFIAPIVLIGYLVISLGFLSLFGVIIELARMVFKVIIEL